jgi:predicted glycosyltransferase
MNILIDLQHPAHLHFFRNVAIQLQNKGHSVRMTGRDKDILVELAENYGIKVDVFGVARKGMVNLGRELVFRQWQLRKIIKEFQPDLMMAIAGTYISLVGKLMGVPVYVFYDTEHATLSNLLSYPFATCVYVPRCYLKTIRWRHKRYNGYHELAYLHPKYFTPDPSIPREVGLKEGEVFTIVRFVAWGAAHDIGQQGFSREDKIRAIQELGQYGRILISAEGDIPAELEPFRVKIDVARIHHLMAYAALIFGESGTMPSEGAVMGVPGIYINPLRLGYLEEQERDYGLVFNFRPEQLNEAISKGVDILSNYQRNKWQTKGRRLVEEKIDVTDMLYQIAMERPFS